MESGSRDLPLEFSLQSALRPANRLANPNIKAMPVLLHFVLERDLIGSAFSSLIWHVRRGA